MPFVLAVSGFKDSGKTTLSLELAERLRAMGADVAFVKHSQDPLPVDASTDSGKALQRGLPALFWSEAGVRLERSGPLDLEEVLFRFFPAVDIVLVEGAKALALPRIWVGHGGDVPAEVSGVIARYDWKRETSLPGERLFGPDGRDDLAALVVDLWRRAEPTGCVLYGGTRRIPAKAFVADFLTGGVKGMVRALKGGDDASQGFSLFIRGGGGKKEA